MLTLARILLTVLACGLVFSGVLCGFAAPIALGAVLAIGAAFIGD